MKAVKTVNELIPGRRYNEVSHQFNNAENEIEIICGDYTGLNRDICYAYFTQRGFKPPKAEDIKSGKAIGVAFAIWQHEIDLNSISIYEKDC
jgi:hypothetical protein